MKRPAVIAAIVLTAFLASPVGAATTVHGTNCTINTYGYYNSWYGQYQSSVTYWDHDCDWVQARIHNTSNTDNGYSYSVSVLRSSLGNGYHAAVQDQSGRQGGFWY